MIFAVLLTINSGTMANKKTDMSIKDIEMLSDRNLDELFGEGVRYNK